MRQKSELFPLLVRLRPKAKALLDQAATEQGKTRASIVDQALLELLEPKFSGVQDRLNAMLGKR